MGEKTAIEWTHHTFSPWRGCTKVSPGCTNCYAEKMSRRNPGVLGVWGDHGTRVVAAESYWRGPVKWDRAAGKAGERRRVFCASLADVFEDRGDGHVHDPRGNVLWVNSEGAIISAGQTTPHLSKGERTATLDDVRERLRWLMFNTPNLDWLILTKRPHFAAKWIRDHLWPPNVWLGTSVEDQARADERIPALLEIPAAVRFLSCEPLLGPVDLTRLVYRGERWNALDQTEATPSIDWVIVGGESGPHARPCDLSWVRSIRDQCRAAGVPVFVKQLGARPYRIEYAINSTTDPGDELFFKLRDSHGGDPSEWSEDLRVREFPRSGAAAHA